VGAPFLWSWSRHRQLERCPRAYWYNYYGARGGWRDDAAPEVREIHRLKKLAGRSQWLGQLVHEAVATVLRGIVWRRPEDEGALRVRLLADAAQAIDIARGRAPVPPKGPPVGFVEVEHGEDPGDAVWAETLSDLATRFDDLMVHPVMRRLREVPDRIVEVDRLRKVRLDGYRLYVAPDVLVADGHGGRVIVDWKTGRSHDPDTVARQMAVYAWWVHHDDGVPIEQIKGLQANVPGAEHLTVSFESSHLDQTRQTVADSVARMRSLLDDPDRDKASMEAFEPLPEGSDVCLSCRFRGPCGRDPHKADN